MKNRNKWLWVAFASLVSTAAFCGEKAGNGGIAYVCRFKGQGIMRADLLDLVEGYLIDGIRYPGQAPVTTLANELQLLKERVAQRAIPRSELFARWLTKNIQELLDDDSRMAPFDGSYAALPDPADFNPRIAPKSEYGQTCGFEVLGLYDDSRNLLRYNDEVAGYFSPDSKIAFLAHEIIYRELRKGGDRYSDRTRRIVGILASEDKTRDGELTQLIRGTPLERVKP